MQILRVSVVFIYGLVQAGGFVEFTAAARLEEARHAAAVRRTCHQANELYFDIRAKHEGQFHAQ